MPDLKSPFPRNSVNRRKKIASKVLIKSVIYAFAIFGVLFILLLLAVLGVIKNSASAVKMPKNAILTVDLDLSFPEIRQDSLLTEMVPTGAVSFRELRWAIIYAAKDKRVKALAARINVSSLGMAQLQELHKSIQLFRDSGKPAYIYSPGFGSFGGGTGEYYLATAFSEITMQPNTDVGLTGVGAEIPFFKAGLDKVGISPEFYGRYEYKNAMASFTDKKISSAFESNMNMMLARLNVVLVKGALNTRFSKPTKEDFFNLTDKAPFSAEYAQSIGLIDKLAFEGDWRNEIRREHNAEFVSVADYAAGIRLNRSGPKLAIITLEGTIGDAYSLNPTADNEINSREVLDIADEIKKDKHVVGALVRVNSPGGSYSASAEIWNALNNLKKEKNIPLVVSMGDYAASGGYFISLAGDKIFADETTLTGSIGVVGGKFALEGLWKKLDVNWSTLYFAPNGGILSPNFKFSKSQKKALDESLDRVYKDFTLKVSQARNIPETKLDKLARGRVWTGEDAKAGGLIDELGGLDDALQYLKEQAGIKPEDKFAMEVYPKPRPLQEKIAELLSSSPLASIKLTAQKLGLDVKAVNMLQRLQYDAVMPLMSVSY